jgi:hypothetical protein
MEWDWSTQDKIYFEFALVCDTFCVLAGTGVFRSKMVEIHFVSSLEWEGGHVEILFVISLGMGGDWSTHVEIYFVCLLAWEGFVQHMFRYILCPCWH